MGPVGGARPGASHAGPGRRSTGRPRAGRLVRLVLLVLAVYLVVVFIDQRLQVASLERQRAEVLERMSYVERRNAALREEVARLGSDSYIEELAREQLGLVDQAGPGGAPAGGGSPGAGAGEAAPGEPGTAPGGGRGGPSGGTR